MPPIDSPGSIPPPWDRTPHGITFVLTPTLAVDFPVSNVRRHLQLPYCSYTHRSFLPVFNRFCPFFTVLSISVGFVHFRPPSLSGRPQLLFYGREMFANQKRRLVKVDILFGGMAICGRVAFLGFSIIRKHTRAACFCSSCPGIWSSRLIVSHHLPALHIIKILFLLRLVHRGRDVQHELCAGVQHKNNMLRLRMMK